MSAASDDRPVAVIAGVGPGLGAAVAAAFTGAGIAVAGLSRTSGFGASLAADLAGAPAPYRHFVADVTDAAHVDETLGRVDRELGRPAVLVYDAMGWARQPFAELSPGQFEAVWRVTCFGAMITARAALPFLLRGGGTMIFSGATASVKGGPRFAALASAKFALRGLAQSLARELGPRRVHVVHATIDGLIACPQTDVRFGAARDARIPADAVAAAYLDLVRQPPSAWTHELDLRPFDETW